MPQQPQQPAGPQKQRNDKPGGPSSSKENLADYFKNHARETISYILLITGILLMFFWPFYGGILVGIVAGIYFGDMIVDYIKNWKGNVSGTANYALVARHIIMLGLAIAFFIAAPGIYLGAAVAIGIKHLFIN